MILNSTNLITFNFSFSYAKRTCLYCSHEIMSRTKLTHIYTHYKFSQHHYLTNKPSQNPQHRFTLNNSKCTSPYFPNFLYCIKNTNIHGNLRNYDPIRQMYIFCPLTRTNSHSKMKSTLSPEHSSFYGPSFRVKLSSAS